MSRPLQSGALRQAQDMLADQHVLRNESRHNSDLSMPSKAGLLDSVRCSPGEKHARYQDPWASFYVQGHVQGRHFAPSPA